MVPDPKAHLQEMLEMFLEAREGLVEYSAGVNVPADGCVDLYTTFPAL